MLSRHSARRGATRESEHSNQGVLAPRSRRILRYDQCALCGLTDSIQHIHSLRASGVISSHAVNACGSDVSVFFKSAGTSCTTPLEIFFCDIDKLSFRKPQRREDLLLSKGCGSFGHLASPDVQVNSALDSPLRSCDAQLGRYLVEIADDVRCRA